MRRPALFALLTAFSLAGAATTYAHHAVQAQFDVTKNLILSGTLKKVDWTNPHAWFHFDVKSAGRRGHGLVGRDDRAERAAPARHQRSAPVPDRHRATRSTSIPTARARPSASSTRSRSRTASSSRSGSPRKRAASRRADGCAWTSVCMSRPATREALMTMKQSLLSISIAALSAAIARCCRRRSCAQNQNKPDLNGIWGGGIAKLTPTTCKQNVNAFPQDQFERFSAGGAKGGAEMDHLRAGLLDPEPRPGQQTACTSRSTGRRSACTTTTPMRAASGSSMPIPNGRTCRAACRGSGRRTRSCRPPTR